MAQDVSFSEGADSALYLGAFTPEDVEVVSSMLQDGVFCMKDLAWTKKKRKLALLVNRFRWESNLPERVRTILIINNESFEIMLTITKKKEVTCVKYSNEGDWLFASINPPFNVI